MFSICSRSHYKKSLSACQTTCTYVMRCLLLRVIGPSLLFIASSLLIIVKIGFIFIFLPDFEGTYMYYVHLIIGSYLFVNVMFNYWLCAFSSPGYPPTCQEIFSNTTDINTYRIVDGKKVLSIPSRLDIIPGASYRYCKHCDCFKPPRAHHDSVSGKCVLHMDHFCPWMSNCVGYENYRPFVLFLVYMFIGCMYLIYITLHSMSLPNRTNRYLKIKLLHAS